MASALEQAQFAARDNEVPVGALVVRKGVVIAKGWNRCIANADPTAHAEIIAIREAASRVSNYRLDDCTLYVTLEPCAMCAGAILNARFERVVYGAQEPKTGACGSVVNLFDQQALNHQTQVSGGVLAEECGALLQHFFSAKRQLARSTARRLREDALRTPELRFEQLDGYPWPPKYEQSLVSLAGLRMHYLDEGPVDANTVFLCIHGNRSWTYAFRDFFPTWVDAACRVVAPDLIGFGRSDKPKRTDAHSIEFHLGYLVEWIAYLNLNNIVLVVQDDVQQLAHLLLLKATQRFRGFLLLEAKSQQRSDTPLVGAYAAPFPDAGHKAGIDFFSRVSHMNADGDPHTMRFWSEDWQGISQRMSMVEPSIAISALNTFVRR
jgi:tRNA(adenine34) deaminase